MNERRFNTVGGGGVRRIGHNIFEEIISLENLFAAWLEFRRGKMKKSDVQQFDFAREDNLLSLQSELRTRIYYPQDYRFFYVRDPKLRPIHKAKVRDRVLFQAVFRVLYHFFDKKFIFDSYACRFGKGTLAGVMRLNQFARRAGANYSRPVYALKCDIKKFFYSVDHKVLLGLIGRTIDDKDTLWLAERIISSFHIERGKGLPLGNVTSQLFSNIYLNELDQYVKHVLKEKFYLRYCDDFIILNRERERLAEIVPRINEFLKSRLQLCLHPQKVEIRKLSQGIDFLGYVVLPHHIVLRTKTKRRMFKKLRQKRLALESGRITPESYHQTLQSYLGILKHGDNHDLETWVKNCFSI